MHDNSLLNFLSILFDSMALAMLSVASHAGSLRLTFSVCSYGADFWQDDMLGVAKFICEGLDIMLGADSDNESQASDQP